MMGLFGMTPLRKRVYGRQPEGRADGTECWVSVEWYPESVQITTGKGWGVTGEATLTGDVADFADVIAERLAANLVRTGVVSDEG